MEEQLSLLDFGIRQNTSGEQLEEARKRLTALLKEKGNPPWYSIARLPEDLRPLVEAFAQHGWVKLREASSNYFELKSEFRDYNNPADVVAMFREQAKGLAYNKLTSLRTGFDLYFFDPDCSQALWKAWEDMAFEMGKLDFDWKGTYRYGHPAKEFHPAALQDLVSALADATTYAAIKEICERGWMLATGIDAGATVKRLSVCPYVAGAMSATRDPKMLEKLIGYCGCTWRKATAEEQAKYPLATAGVFVTGASESSQEENNAQDGRVHRSLEFQRKLNVAVWYEREGNSIVRHWRYGHAA
jgi:hypothetical protein